MNKPERKKNQENAFTISHKNKIIFSTDNDKKNETFSHDKRKNK